MLWLVNIVAFLINAVVVGLSTTGVWGETNEAVSDDNPTLVTPDGYVERLRKHSILLLT